MDEAYYYYKKAMHEGNNYDVEKEKVASLEIDIKNFDPLILEKEQALHLLEDKLLLKKVTWEKIDKELRTLLYRVLD